MMIMSHWNRPYRFALIVLLFTGPSFNASAEIRYVTDELQLSLYEEINSQGKLLLRLNSGTELELLETSGFYARVRTMDGVEGWTKAGFLISEKPARAQLLGLQNENNALQQQLAKRQQALVLVIHQNVPNPSPTSYIMSTASSLEQAAEDLARRERTNLDHIGYAARNGGKFSRNEGVAESTTQWLDATGIDAAVRACSISAVTSGRSKNAP